MQKNVILDTGVLVAFLMPSDKHHHWAVSSLQAAKYPVLTCEAVLTETCFLLQRIQSGREKVLQLVKQGYLRSCTIQEKGLQKEQKCEKKGVVVN